MSDFNSIIEIKGMDPIQQDELNQEHIHIVEDLGDKKRVMMDGVMYDVLVKEFNYETKSAIINVDGFDFTLELKEPLDILINDLGFLKASKHSVKEVKSPMPGLVVKVFVSEGQQVVAGDKLLTLEAMKMENILKSPGDGTIKSIKVKGSDTVDKNQVLIEFE